MVLESLLAYAHFLAILSMVALLGVEAALCRPLWLNEAVVERLGKVDLFYGLTAGLVLLTGVLRTWLGMKGTAWYWTNPLLHFKLTVFVVIALVSIKPTLMFLRWRKEFRAGGALPGEAQIKSARRWVMVQAHLLPLIPLAAVFLARGYGK
jgi:putative membrane protein